MSLMDQDHLIICDWESEEYAEGAPAEVLRAALVKWDTGRTYSRPPRLLTGGFEKFRLAHPHLVTDPKVRAPPTAQGAEASASWLPPSLAGVEYPDLDTVSIWYSTVPYGISCYLLFGAIGTGKWLATGAYLPVLYYGWYVR